MRIHENNYFTENVEVHPAGYCVAARPGDTTCLALPGSRRHHVPGLTRLQATPRAWPHQAPGDTMCLASPGSRRHTHRASDVLRSISLPTLRAVFSKSYKLLDLLKEENPDVISIETHFRVLEDRRNELTSVDQEIYDTLLLDEDSRELMQISHEEKFQYLIQATSVGSRARSIVGSFPPSGENYKRPLQVLQDRFGRKDLLVEYYTGELLKLVVDHQAMNQKIIAATIPSVAVDCTMADELPNHKIQLAKDSDSPVELLMGADIAGKLWTGRRNVLFSGLIVMETVFGWTVMGRRNVSETTEAPYEQILRTYCLAGVWRFRGKGQLLPFRVS
ncbi:hypothetical protein PR048_032155 [Dryococelus australis]|uniref:Uncharacterized protein n=1 Tax=Dryococelus australis TaxID=614101 RepID=A0ABQ9G2L7_9NEOP|nr:hypothetical protein PR048_032155 [Dryococelus australis]